MTRREFLTTAASVPIAASALSATEVPAAPRTAAPVVDAHVHCFAGPDDDCFPYHANAPYRPGLPAPPERLLSLMNDAGVDFAVIVHPEPYQDDHRYLEHCLDVGNGRLRGVCLFFAEQSQSVARLKELVRRRSGEIVALRVHAYAPERLPPFDQPELRTLWKTAADLGIAVQVHLEPRYAPRLEPLIREFRETTVLVDHLGRPFQGTPEEHAVVVRWAELPHVVMKLSSLPVKENYPHRDPAPVVKTLLDAYGADRLVYGGGHGPDATTASYRAARERVAAHLPGLSHDEIANVLGGNAARLFGIA